MTDQPIGIMDSGVGGLTVAQELQKQMPNETFIYFGDVKNCPYGDKTEPQIIEYVEQVVNFLLRFRIKALVIACNTATAITIEMLKNKLDIPVIGVIEPGVRAALNATNKNSIGIIATKATIQTREHEKIILMKKQLEHIELLACPSFVPAIENHFFDKMIIKKEIKEQLSYLRHSTIDTLILGCTHYPLIKEEIKQYIGSDIILIDPSVETIKELKETLIREKKEAKVKEKESRYFVSEGVEKFTLILNYITNKNCEVEMADLTKYKKQKEPN